MNKSQDYNESIENIIADPTLTPQEKKGALAHLKSLLNGNKIIQGHQTDNKELFHMVNEKPSQQAEIETTKVNQQPGKVLIKTNNDIRKAGFSSPLLLAVSTAMFGTIVILIGIIVGSLF